MDLQSLTTDDLANLVIGTSELIEQRRHEEAQKKSSIYERRHATTVSQTILKPATLPDPTASLNASNEELQPAPKRLKGVTLSNRYQAFSTDENNDSDSDAVSTEEDPPSPLADSHNKQTQEAKPVSQLQKRENSSNHHLTSKRKMGPCKSTFK